MMADTVLKQAINSVSHNGERVGSNLVKLVCWAVLVPVIWKLVRRPVRLSSRLWKLLGGLTLAPLMATLSFSLGGREWWETSWWITSWRGSPIPSLPFASLSALALLAALACSPGTRSWRRRTGWPDCGRCTTRGSAGAGPGARPAP